MSVDGQFDCPPSESDLEDSGLCSFCAAPNPRSNIACHFCGSRLPWTFEAVGRFMLDRKLLLARLEGKTETNAETNTRPALLISKESLEQLSQTTLRLEGPLLLTCDIVDNRVIKP